MVNYIRVQVEQVDSMVCELADVVASERALLDQCRDILSSMTALQVTLDFPLYLKLLN